MLQKEHTESIERITKSKESERQAIEIMRIDGTNIQNVLNKSQVIVEGLENLQKKFESRDNSFVDSQDQHLLLQEKNIECKLILYICKKLFLILSELSYVHIYFY